MQIPFLDLARQHQALKQEILPLWAEILDSAGFIGGRHVAAFEEEFAALLGAPHCVAVGSGTDALRFILLALGLKAGDEVITVPNTFIAPTEAISQAGGRIVFADIDPRTYTIDPARIDAAITPRTRGIIPVHLYGQPADMDPLGTIAERHGLWLVEDACQAHLAEYKGRKAGTLGRAAAFSFYPGKNLGACGEAGAVTTSDATLAATVRMLRDHGQNKKYYHDIEGYNGRCDALQAAALRVKLKYLPQWTAARQAHAATYQRLLAGCPGLVLPTVAPWASHVFHLFVIQISRRDQVLAALTERGISCGLHYPLPLHLQQVYRHRSLPSGAFPVTEHCAERLLSLPMYPELTSAAIEHVCRNLRDILEAA